jgi:chromosomal replication initiator protein
VCNAFLKIIKDDIVTQSFKTWFEPIIPIKLEDNILTIQVPSLFFYEWLEEHYVGLLRKALKNQLGDVGRLEYNIVVDNSSKNGTPNTTKMPSCGNAAETKMH